MDLVTRLRRLITVTDLRLIPVATQTCLFLLSIWRKADVWECDVWNTNCLVQFGMWKRGPHYKPFPIVVEYNTARSS